MRFELTYRGNLPSGYVNEIVDSGETSNVIVREFTSSSDGELFLTRLEGFPSRVLDLLPNDQKISVSQVDNMLAILKPDGNLILYVNEQIAQLKIRAKRNIEAGTAVFDEDIADIEECKFENIEIPPDAAVAYLFSKGWRKGFYFDFAPIIPQGSPREYNLNRQLGECHAFLIFQHLFRMTEADWDKMFERSWFPFISLESNLLRDIIDRCRNSRELEALGDRIKKDTDRIVAERLPIWQSNPIFKDHIALINKAIEEYRKDDYISAISVLYPRLEGLMRNHLFTLNPSAGKKQTEQVKLTEHVIEGYGLHLKTNSLLLPARFKNFLQDIYFKNFDHKNPTEFNRNTVNHGVASADSFNLLNTLLGILILDQLSFFVTPVVDSSP